MPATQEMVAFVSRRIRESLPTFDFRIPTQSRTALDHLVVRTGLIGLEQEMKDMLGRFSETEGAQTLGIFTEIGQNSFNAFTFLGINVFYERSAADFGRVIDIPKSLTGVRSTKFYAEPFFHRLENLQGRDVTTYLKEGLIQGDGLAQRLIGSVDQNNSSFRTYSLLVLRKDS